MLTSGILSLTSLANIGAVYATFGLVTEDEADLWMKIRQGAARSLTGEGAQPLTTIQDIQMILGALQLVDD